MARLSRSAGIAAFLALLVGACSAPARHAPCHPTGARSKAGSSALELEAIPSPLYAAPLLTPRGELFQLQFWLNLHNRGATPVELQRLEIHGLSKGKVLIRRVLERAALKHELRAVPWIVMRDRQTFSAAHRWRGKLTRPMGGSLIKPDSTISISRRFSIHERATLPDELRIVALAAGTGARAELRLPVQRYRQKVSLRLPVGERWQVLAGHRFDGTHGQAFVRSQTFAYDLGVLGADLSTRDPAKDRSKNTSYRAHDRPILAAADGVVAMVHDGVPENLPVGRRPSWQTLLNRPRDLAGNFVVLDHGGGEFSAYMHLRPGISLSKGQQLKAGQTLGRCGNSGNSSEPHLHFQLQDGPDPLTAGALPARFGDITYQRARLRLHAPADRPIPLPSDVPVQAGKLEGAVDIGKWLDRR